MRRKFKTRFRRSLILVLLSALTPFSLTNLESAGWKDAKVSIVQGKVRGLRISPSQSTVRFKKVNGVPKPLFVLRGDFRKRGWGLYWKKKWIVKSISKNRKFAAPIPLNGKVTTLRLGVVSPQGAVQALTLRVDFPGWARYQKLMAKRNKKSQEEEEPEEEQEETEEAEEEQEEEKKEKISPKSKPKRTVFSLSLGGTSIKYQEQGIDDYSGIGITAKGFLRFQLFNPKWDLGMNAYITALTLGPSRTDVDVRFIGMNARIGYTVFYSRPWAFRLMAGWYFTTMMVTNKAFGFENLSGPQVFPVIQYQLSGGSAIYAYFKYSPLITVSSDGPNVETAFGAGYVTFLGNGHPLTFSLDIANLQFVLSNIQVKNQTFSFSIGYGLF